MIEGWFDRNGHPYVTAVLVLPRLGFRRLRLEFLVDTGASQTVLHPRDCAGMPYDRLTAAGQSGGVGGLATYYSESAYIAFRDDTRTHVYLQTVGIAEPNGHNDSIPSLLGQDIMQNWRVLHDRPANNLTIDVVQSDLTIVD